MKFNMYLVACGIGAPEPFDEFEVSFGLSLAISSRSCLKKRENDPKHVVLFYT